MKERFMEIFRIKLKVNFNFCLLILLSTIMINVSLDYLFFFVVFSPLFFVFYIILMSSYKIESLRIHSLFLSLLLLIASFVLWVKFLYLRVESYIVNFQWDSLNFDFMFGIDLLVSNFTYTLSAISIFFILLTNFLILVSVMITWNWAPFFYSMRLFLILVFLLQFFCINFFLSSHLIIFYIFFESVLIPMYFLIGIWGLRDRKIHASYQFFLYTFFGSLFLLVGIIFLGACNETFDMNFLAEYWWFLSELHPYKQMFIWLCLFLGFAIKVPMVPFHIWLPEAHVEAPTAGSIILAGILLKFGTYGIYRVLLQIMPFATVLLGKFVIIMSLVAIFYASIINYAQIDLKKIIAYSSVSHMGYVTLGLVLDNMEGIIGSLYMMITHGFISGGLFYIVGILYERYGTRNIYYYGGLKNIMPKYVFFFFLLTLANMNLPLTGGFVAEFLVLLGTGGLLSKFISFLAALGLVTNGIYCIWLFNRLSFGENIVVQGDKKLEYMDIDKREDFIIMIFVFFIFLLGIFPNGIINVLEPQVYEMLWGKRIYFGYDA